MNDIKTDTLFYEYYDQWLVIYKEGSVRLITMQKYHLTADWVKRLIPTVRLSDFDRIASTHLLTIDNKEVIIPNSSISTSNIVNYTSQDKRGVFLSYHVSYNTDIDLVKNVIMGVINKNKTIFKEPVPFIVVGKHEENGMEIIVRVWCKTSDYWNVYFYMQENIKKSFDDNNIEIPFTQIDVHNIPQIERNEKITKQSDKKKT